MCVPKSPLVADYLYSESYNFMGVPESLLFSVTGMGVAGNTIFVVSTDNGAKRFSLPDGGTTSFKGCSEPSTARRETCSQMEGRLPGLYVGPLIVI
jgi:hypothetical protein